MQKLANISVFETVVNQEMVVLPTGLDFSICNTEENVTAVNKAAKLYVDTLKQVISLAEKYKKTKELCIQRNTTFENSLKEMKANWVRNGEDNSTATSNYRDEYNRTIGKFGTLVSGLRDKAKAADDELKGSEQKQRKIG